MMFEIGRVKISKVTLNKYNLVYSSEHEYYTVSVFIKTYVLMLPLKTNDKYA